MSHDPESPPRPEAAARDDLSADPETPLSGGSGSSDDPVDPDGAADRPHHQSHDPYQPL
ncbi:hypothetical protein [Microbacterium jejuense]|uniref:hypothetical protein n=1 Tax=Microbacterium jejuense TaxID=1263637 RepID=UPI0031EF489F